jgi:hypothetical protein
MDFMSETTPPAPAPAPTGGKTPKHHGLLDKHQLAEISKTNIIYGVINSDPAILARIQDEQVITPAFLTALGADLETTGQYTGAVAQASVEGKISTTAEDDAKTALLKKIHYIQSKASLKYAGGNRNVLAEYAIGTNLDLNRPTLETAAGNIVNKLKTDTLPKITAQHGTDLQAALAAYKQTKTDQVGEKGDATTLRVKLAAVVDSVAVRRRQLQHAADGEYPWTDPANAGIRRKLDLPASQPLNA